MARCHQRQCHGDVPLFDNLQPLVVLVSKNRPVTPTEVLLSQGMPATGLEGTAKQLPVSRSFLAGCSPGAVMGAAGNGLHSGVFGAWWAYCMAHLVPKAAIQGTINLISDTSDSELEAFDLEDM